MWPRPFSTNKAWRKAVSLCRCDFLIFKGEISPGLCGAGFLNFPKTYWCCFPMTYLSLPNSSMNSVPGFLRLVSCDLPCHGPWMPPVTDGLAAEPPLLIPLTFMLACLIREAAFACWASRRFMVKSIFQVCLPRRLPWSTLGHLDASNSACLRGLWNGRAGCFSRSRASKRSWPSSGSPVLGSITVKIRCFRSRDRSCG